MNSIRKLSGIIWMAIGIVSGYFNVMVMGIPKIISGKQEDLVFGIVNLFILTPIIVGGLLIFGWYALRNEYAEENN